MSAVGDFVTLLGFSKDVRNLLRAIPDGLGFSLVHYSESGPTDEDHIRIVNLTPLTLHGVKFTIQQGEHGEPTPLSYVLRSGEEDCYGRKVLYRIAIPKAGIYMHPAATFYIPCKELPLHITPTDDIRMRFTYVFADGREGKGNLQHLVRVLAKVAHA
jgi:hypothetical protein